jgi:23S rRNA (guanosine2251-2'-O)-methyltransferase
MIIYGLNAVAEALRARRVRRLRVSARSDRRMDEILALAAKDGVPIERVDRTSLDRVARDGLHQGVVADVQEGREYAVDDLVAPGDGPPLIVVMDGIEDPHNVGAILRTADAAGVSGIVRQSRHAAALDGVVGKASAGALALARIATVVNIARALEELSEANVWSVGLAGDASDVYSDVDWTLPTALVLGAEGTGLRRLVRDRCDRIVRIPMFGAIESLNVSVAAGIVLYEAVRQRAVKGLISPKTS